MNSLKLIGVLISCLFISCKSQNFDKRSPGLENVRDSNKRTKIINKTVSTVDTTGFFKNCEQLMNGSSIGALQGTNHSDDSTSNLCFLDNYENKSFEIILLLKGGIGKRKTVDPSKIVKLFNGGCRNMFTNFDCYAFVLPMRDPQTQIDLNEMNIDFPVTVKSYRRITSDNWQFLREFKAKTFRDLSDFQFATIYDLHTGADMQQR